MNGHRAEIVALVMNADEVSHRVLSPTGFQLSMVEGHRFSCRQSAGFAVMSGALLYGLHDVFVQYQPSLFS